MGAFPQLGPLCPIADIKALATGLLPVGVADDEAVLAEIRVRVIDRPGRREAAALFLLSEKRKADEVVDKLKPSELELVIEVVQQSPECFPPRAFAALQACRPTSLKASAPSDPPSAGRNPYGITLDDASLRWAAAEGVPASVIAAICLLDEQSVDEIVTKLTTAELDQVIQIVGRSPRGYPPGAYDALKGKRNLAQPSSAYGFRRSWPLEVQWLYGF